MQGVALLLALGMVEVGDDGKRPDIDRPQMGLVGESHVGAREQRTPTAIDCFTGAASSRLHD